MLHATPVFLTFKLRLICFATASLKRWIAEWIKADAVIVLVIIQLSDHKSFWLRRFDSRQRLTHHFFIMADITYEYYSLFLYLYSSEVRNNDFHEFPLSNQTMIKLCMSWFIVNKEFRKKKISNSNRQVMWIILIQYRLLPTYVTNYFITTTLYVDWYVASNIQKQNILENKI